MSAAAEAARVSRTFDKTLYAVAAIQDAIEAYAGLATLTVDKSDEAWTVHFDAVDPDIAPEVLASELANYVLAGTIDRKR